MSLFLITGSAGTGKSQVCLALKALGYEAYDTDDDGLARWQNITTGYIHPKSSVKPEQRTELFIAEHAWNVPRQHIQELAIKATAKVIFVCGSAGNEDELRDIFSRVFVLHVDDDTLTHRLTTRTTNDWGKQHHELAQTLEHHHAAYEQYRQRGDIIIDASLPLKRVVDTIIAQI